MSITDGHPSHLPAAFLVTADVFICFSTYVCNVLSFLGFPLCVFL